MNLTNGTLADGRLSFQNGRAGGLQRREWRFSLTGLSKYGMMGVDEVSPGSARQQVVEFPPGQFADKLVANRSATEQQDGRR